MNVENMYVALFNQISKQQLTNPGVANAKGKLVASAISFGLPQLAQRMRGASLPGATISGTNEMGESVQRPTIGFLERPDAKKKPVPAPVSISSGKKSAVNDPEPETPAIDPENSELSVEAFEQLDAETLAAFGADALRSFAGENGIEISSRMKNPASIAAKIRAELESEI